MSKPSIPDRAAALVNAFEAAASRIDDVRSLGGEWVSLQIMLSTIVEAVDTAAKTHMMMVLRLHDIANAERKRLEGTKQ